MAPVELRDLDAARQFILQGLRLQRALPPSAASIRPALQWSLEIAASGLPLPPVGFVADLGHILLGFDRTDRAQRSAHDAVGLPGGLARAYEDFVLGKCYADASVERAGVVVRRLTGRDQNRAVAFVTEQFCERADAGGVLLSPAVIKSLAEAGAEDVVGRGWESLQSAGLMPLLANLYAALVTGSRRVAEVLSPEDVFELEHGTALADLSQRLALRQVIALSGRMASTVRQRGKPRVTSEREVASRVLDEDIYPVGGFASLSTRGSVESLLHSQLAYMEPDKKARPDLFDVKYLRDELLYYSRDENQFLRRRRFFGFIFTGGLKETRFKDPDLPAQRIIMTLAFVTAAIHTLTDWLSTDALQVALYFPSHGGSAPLAQEQELMAMVFREAIGNGTVRIGQIGNFADAVGEIARLEERSVCRSLVVGAQDIPADIAGVTTARFMVAGSRPTLAINDDVASFDDIEPGDSWSAALERLVHEWMD
jgi:vWA domain found in the FtsH ternary systems/N-terminal helical region fused to the FtsH ternary system vWA domain